MILEGMAQQTIREMEKDGRVQTLTMKQTYDIDHNLAQGLAPIKKESERRQRQAWAQISGYESGRALYKR